VSQQTTADGNIDDPQFQWLSSELDKARAADELVITFAHHGSTTLDFTQPDELAAPCSGDDTHGHDSNPGCDADPRSSSPIHNSDDFIALLNSHPNVIAHVAGHSHDANITPHPSGDGGWWEIRSPAVADWPSQSRLLDVMDNKDGTLSIFATLFDHDSPVGSPGSGADTSSADVETLASLGRTIGFNDTQVGHTSEGQAKDRNVELLMFDPRATAVGGGGGEPGLGCHGEVRGTRKRDRLTGTQRDDLIIGFRGPDRIAGLAGNDCLRGSGGNDRIFGGTDNDLINAGAGRDRVKPGAGVDAVRAGRGADRVNVRDGARDRVKCGPGLDSVRADKRDVLRGCERAVRRR
jgi:Ca2+-binding RTX toxin-like protein